jgi:hypothetical protein
LVNSLIGNHPTFTVPKSVSGGVTVAGVSIDAQVMYIPLEFWFCRNPDSPFPSLLQYHEVKVNFEFTDLKDLMVYETDQFAVEGNMGYSVRRLYLSRH